MSRYEKQVMLPEIGESGQERLLGSVVGVIGLGALGSVTCEILARAGVGKIILMDYDIVQLSNLQRQSLYTQEDVGIAKVHAAATHLKKINSEIEVIAVLKQLNTTSTKILDEVDLILDCTDNMHSRFLFNEYCKKEKKAWVYCGAVEMRGAVALFDEGVCFHCIFDGLHGENTCDDVGVLGAASHMAASLQCALGIRYLTSGEYESELLQFSVWPFSAVQVKMKQKKNCSVCNGVYKILGGKEFIDFCMTKQCVKVRPSKEKSIDFSLYEGEQLDGSKRVVVEEVGVLLHEGGAMEISTSDLDLAKRIAQKIWK